MDPIEYENLERLDEQHWFYRGKREIVRTWVDRFITLRPEDLWIDAGTGTGTLLVQVSDTCRVIGLDNHEKSIAIARARLEAVGGEVIQTDLDRVDLPDACATVITMLDVLEHLDDDGSALREMIRLTRPGGLIVITVPALGWLWSDWDVSLHHRRRYYRRDLLRLVRQQGVEMLRCTYFNSLILPAVVAVRLWRRVRPLKAGGARLEDRLLPAVLDRALNRSFVAPATWPAFHPLAGLSLLAILRRS